MDQYIGKLLDNRYEILEVIGTGGMARVYKARCHRLNRLVAIKILREDLAQDAEFRRRFHDESQAVAMLSHPNIVAVYDVSRSSEVEYIVMELIDGISLMQYMQKKGNKLNWREALHFTTQIVKALGHAHSRGIIHRDIKPHNVMVLRDGSVKVADFGIARVVSGGHSTLTQEALGSVHYISPEQARGSHIDARSDLYSAGVVLYEMITGRLPFEGDTPVSVAIQHINSIPLSPRELDPSLPEALEAITMKAMAPSPNNRYGSADQMLADLEEFRKNPNINFDYNIREFEPEEADDNRTRIHSRTAGYHVDSRTRMRSDLSPNRYGENRRTSYHYEEDDRRRTSPWVILGVVGTILLLVGLVLFFLFNNFLSGLFTPVQTYSVPKLVGQDYEEVMEDAELLQNRFEVVVEATITNDAEAGTILKQSPAAESQVDASVTEITVVVSGGPEVIYMIDLKDMEYREAFIALNEKGLKYDMPTYEFHDEIPEGHVISFTPLADTPVYPGTTTVQMVLSKGPERKEFPMPSLEEMTQENAESRINTMNLVVGSVTQVYSDTVAVGKVVSQYPEATATVKEGTRVNLEISKGPDPNAPPPEVTRTVTVQMPDAGKVVNVQVMMDGDLIHIENVDTAMTTAIEFEVTASGTKDLTVYIDGALYKTIKKEFVP